MTAFEEMGVLPEIAKAVDEMEWTLPTDVQAEGIPLILGGGDVLIAAETGSGKTGAFCLPVIQIVWETLKDLQEGKGSKSEFGSSISPHWLLSFMDRGKALAVAPDGLRCQSREQKEWHGCRANKGVQGSGKYYYEATAIDEGLCRVGWSSSQASLDLGTDVHGYGFGGTGKKSNARKFDDYGEAYGKCDVISCLLDLDKGEISYWKNGVNLGCAFTLNVQQSPMLFPAVVLKNAEMSFNFGAQPFKFSPPPGFLPISSAPEQCVRENPHNQSGQTKKESKPVNNAPMAVIVEPSRELAEQTYNEIQKFKEYLNDPRIRQLLIVAGVGAKEQIAALNRGVDIVVGTPGRLENLIDEGLLPLTNCRFFVLDEVDGLIKMNQLKFINKLHSQMPKMTVDGKRLQMIVCSATLHDFEVKKMAERLMHFPTWIDLKGEDAVPETVHHVIVNVDPRTDKWQNLRNRITTDQVHARDNIHSGMTTPESLSEGVKILKGEYCIRAIDEHKMDRGIIFCRTKLDCDNLERFFNKSGAMKYSCVCLHSDRPPRERQENLRRFKQQEAKFLICTDVAARGIDISGLPYLINVTLPDEKSNYVHRIGRVGRAERMGLAISLVSTVPEKVWYHGCPSKGKSCYNTNLTNQGGCCIWYNETRLLAEIEDHLNITIEQIKTDMKVPTNCFDGKVIYGEKRAAMGSDYENHVQEMAPVVSELATLESEAQLFYLNRHLMAR